MPVGWDPELTTGSEEIDRAHRDVFAAFNTLQEAMKQGRGKEEIGMVFAFLERHVQDHFQAEERLMREHSFPGYQGHQDHHQAFLHKFLDWKREYLERGQSSVLAIDTLTELKRWIETHIKGLDKELALFLRKKG